MKLILVKDAEQLVHQVVLINVLLHALDVLAIVILVAEDLVLVVVQELALDVLADAVLDVLDVVHLVALDVVADAQDIVKLPVKMDVQLIVMLIVLAVLNKKK